MRMEARIVMVTGAARGIGLGCALRFAEEGAAVAVVDVDGAAGAEAADRLRGLGASALFLQADVGRKAEVDAAIEQTLRSLGPIDVLISNAAINRPAEFLDVSEADFDLVLRTNLTSTFLVGQAVARQMVANGRRGAIINMSSGNAVMTGPTLAAYAASKGGICSLTRVMALSLARYDIRVNAIGPGTILTEMTRSRLWDDAGARTVILSRTPLGRFGEPADVAGMALFLASEDAAYVTGQTFFVDGGRNALNYLAPVDETRPG